MWNASDFGWGEFARSKSLPPPQTGRMTQVKLTALIRAGYGQGHFQRYKPWLRVTKRDSSPVSVVGHLPAPTLGRLHHFRSIAERKTIQTAKWLGAVDVREQFPLWPWEHPHPGEGLPGFEDIDRVIGLLTIAEEARISHGYFLGTSIPYVASLDMLTTWKDNNGRIFLVALDNKPEEITRAPNPLSRAKQRLELTRRYSIAARIRHLVVHAENFPQELTVNLDAFEPKLTTPELQRVTASLLYREVVEALNENGYAVAPAAVLRRIEARRSCPLPRLHSLFHLALWRLDVDHDLTLPFRPTEPLHKGGIALWHEMRKAWLGERA